MARERGRRTFTLSDAAHKLLDGLDNYSQYIDAIVTQHGREWTDAMAVLRTHGWSGAELSAACEALGGYGLSGAARDGAFLADELAAAQDRDHIFTKFEVPAPRRLRCLKQLREQPAVAYALSTVIREYWIPNEVCQAAVQRRDH